MPDISKAFCSPKQKRCVHPSSGQARDESNLGFDSDNDTASIQSSHVRLAESQPVAVRDNNESPSASGSAALRVGFEAGPNQESRQATETPKPAAQASPLIAHHNSSGSAPQRFVGDLNPEAVFLDRVETTHGRQSVSQRDPVGVWLDKKEWDALVRREGVASHDVLVTSGAASLQGPEVATRDHLVQDSALLEKSDQDALIRIYFSRINSLFPLLDDEASFSPSQREGNVSSVLVRAVCLVAAKDGRAEPHLRLRSHPSMVMKPRDFAKHMYASVTEALRSDLKIEKVTLIRVLALASMHSEGPDGAEESSLHLAQAIHHAQTIGLHIGRLDDSRSDAAMAKLFWCLWGLDKLNAAINGRPVMISDYDVGVSKFASGKEDDAAFEVLLELLSMLNKVIDLYRPATSPAVTGWEESFPGFEAIVDGYSGWNMPPSMLGMLPISWQVHTLTMIQATLELLYLLIAILSHRSRSLKDRPLPTASYSRQSLSALQIISYTAADNRKDLHPIPLVPYAISLALSVVYRRLRQSKLSHQQESAERDFRACCKTLRTMGRWWWSADVMAALASRVLDEVDKAARTADIRISSRTRSSTSGHECVEKEVASGSSQTWSPDTQLRQEQSFCAQSSTAHSPPAIFDAQNGAYHTAISSTSPADFRGNAANKQGHVPDQMQAGLTANFDGIDDIFGAYLDPNFPVNFDDLVFAECGTYGSWNNESDGYCRTDTGG